MDDEIHVIREVFLFTRDFIASIDADQSFRISPRGNVLKLKMWWEAHCQDNGRQVFAKKGDALICSDEIEATLLIRQVQAQLNREFT